MQTQGSAGSIGAQCGLSLPSGLCCGRALNHTDQSDTFSPAPTARMDVGRNVAKIRFPLQGRELSSHYSYYFKSKHLNFTS